MKMKQCDHLQYKTYMYTTLKQPHQKPKELLCHKKWLFPIWYINKIFLFLSLKIILKKSGSLSFHMHMYLRMELREPDMSGYCEYSH